MPQSLPAVLEASATRRPDAPAVILPGERVSNAELWQASGAAAAWLWDHGIRPGEVVALDLHALQEDIVHQIAVFYGLQWIGAIVLPLYADLAPARRALLTRHFGAHWRLGGVPDPERAPTGAAADCRSLPMPPRGGTAEAPRHDRHERGVLFDFSSGTTGTPKAVLFTAYQMFGILRSVNAGFGWDPGLRLVTALPWPQKVGVRWTWRAHAVGGAMVCVPFPESYHQLDEDIGTYGVTALMSSPWQLRRLMASPPSPSSQHRLQFLCNAGAPITPEEVQQARARICPRLHVIYGSSEGGILSSLRPGDDADAAYTPPADVDIQVVDGSPPEGGTRVLPRGELGVLRFRAPWIPEGFAGPAPSDADRFRHGWYYPGDIGWLDEQGRMRLAGRSDAVINIGGAKLLPVEVERVLKSHPAVADAAVIGVPDAMSGQRAVGFLCFSAPVEDPRELIDHCRQELAGWQVPTVLLTLPAIPRSPEGKVLVDRLEESHRAWLEGRGRRQ